MLFQVEEKHRHYYTHAAFSTESSFQVRSRIISVSGWIPFPWSYNWHLCNVCTSSTTQILAVFVTQQLAREFILTFIKLASHADSQHKYRNLISFIDKCEAKYTAMPKRSSLHSLSLPFRQKPEWADETCMISAWEINCCLGSSNQAYSCPFGKPACPAPAAWPMDPGPVSKTFWTWITSTPQPFSGNQDS